MKPAKPIHRVWIIWSVVIALSSCGVPPPDSDLPSPVASTPPVSAVNATEGETPYKNEKALSLSSATVEPTLIPEPDYLTLQDRNPFPKNRLQSLPTTELADNRIGHIVSNFWDLNLPNEGWIQDDFVNLGAKWVRLSINEADAAQVNWDHPETEILPGYDETISSIAAKGITIVYRLQFWDKAYHASGGAVTAPRFKTPEEVHRYTDFARFIVAQFKDRIQYYEIWNEPAQVPSNDNLMAIDVEDYLNLVRQAIPVIREEYPEAKIAVGSISGMPVPEIQEYLFTILGSDFIPQVDLITWHPLFGDSPETDPEYYRTYPQLVQKIKEMAVANGFQGEFMAEEIIYRSPDCSWCNPSDHLYSDVTAAKYYARGIMLHLGMDVGVGIAGNSHVRRVSFTTIQNLCTIMAGARAEDIPITIDSQAANIRGYTFVYPNGDRLIALWTDGVAVKWDPGVSATVTAQGIHAKKVTALDALNDYEQELVFREENGNLVIPDLMVKDYPIILHLKLAD